MLDRCFDFALSFPSSIVSQILGQFSPPSDALILDPFCGTGTTLVECKRKGFNSIGIDANPVCTLAARVKTRWQFKEANVEQELRRIITRARDEYRRFEASRQAAKRHDRYLHPTKWKTFAEAKQGQFLITSGLIKRGWISPRPALKCLLLIRGIESCPEKPTKELLLVSLLGLLVPEFSNVKYGPEIYCSQKQLDVDVFTAYKNRVTSLLASIESHRAAHSPTTCKIILGNCINGGLSRLQPESVSHVITSPPYPAEHDYTRMTRLELAFGGFIGGQEDLQNIKRSMVPCSSKSSYADQKYYDHVKSFSYVKNIRKRILSASKDKEHGFARVYPRLVGDYFGAMFLHFRALKPFLKPGAQCAYIVGDQSSFFGIHIRTAIILQQMLESEELGFEVTGSEVFRNRHGTSGNGKRRIPETILYFTKPSQSGRCR